MSKTPTPPRKPKKPKKPRMPAREAKLPSRTDDVWETNPLAVRQFLDRRDDYEQLCAEISYILRKRLGVKSIAVAAITSRAKTLGSFLEKIRRKPYSDPFSQITDFAGVRVVCLYPTDISTIEAVIREEFDVKEKVDKLGEKTPAEFGYLAMHYIVSLGKHTSGARYDDLKGLKCEVQVRTVLQDAWAIVQHHLMYKHESDIPSTLQRKLNSLAGLFETADDQFQRIRDERETYLQQIRDAQDEVSAFLAFEANLDSVRALLLWYFPGVATEHWAGQLGAIFADIQKKHGGRFKTLGDLHGILEATKAERATVRTALAAEPFIMDKKGEVPSGYELAWAVALTIDGFAEAAAMPPNWIEAVKSAKK